ncbi:MAG: hypothetical protein CMI90_03405 [Pelagibacteraceae bacterium]|nr:hypothetical protein [Pelagibacteraceae bacterium]|tara:strand:- start:1106 stop:1513 length:408 start_codon:yes stop_codon:yes gene_type:complete
MNFKFVDTLYFKEDNILEIILGIHRTNKLIQQEILIEIEKNDLTLNEFLVLIEIRKEFKQKIQISKKLFIKRQNINIIFQTLLKKELINKNNQITNHGNSILDKSIKKISEKIKILFEKIDHKNMSGFINILENL